MRGSSEERLAGESNEAERIQAQEPGPQVPLLVGADPLPRVPTGSSSFSPQRHFHEDGAGEELTESIGSRESLELAVIRDQRSWSARLGGGGSEAKLIRDHGRRSETVPRLDCRRREQPVPE